MKDFIKLIESNIAKEIETKKQYDSWKQEDIWEDNPKLKQSIPLEPGEYICRRVENNKPCLFCGKLCYKSPNKLCAGFKEIVYPSCKYCNKDKVRCKCVLGKLHEQLVYL